MASAKNSLLGLQKALKIHTGDGDYTIDPAQDPVGYANLLERSRDQRVLEARAVQDAAPVTPGLDPGQVQQNKVINRSAEDAAMGPAGFNRQWAGFFEAPNVLQDNNPGMKFKYDYGTMGNPATQLAGISGKKKKPMPQTDEEFLAGNPGLKKRLGEL